MVAVVTGALQERLSLVTLSCLSVSITSNHTDPACGAEPQRAGTPCHPFSFFHVFQKDCDSLNAVLYLVFSCFLSSPLSLLCFRPCPSCQSFFIWDLFVTVCSPSPLQFFCTTCIFLSAFQPSLQFSLTSDQSFCSLTSPCFQFLISFLALTRFI